jgi:hypothetical protein
MFTIIRDYAYKCCITYRNCNKNRSMRTGKLSFYCNYHLRVYPGKYPIFIVQEAGWAPGLVWTGAENLIPIRILSPDRPPVVSRYTYHATRGPHYTSIKILHTKISKFRNSTYSSSFLTSNVFMYALFSVLYYFPKLRASE